MARDLNEWGLRGVYERDRQGKKRQITKGRVFDPWIFEKSRIDGNLESIRNYAPQKPW
jgi:hypothetical protein